MKVKPIDSGDGITIFFIQLTIVMIKL